MAELNGNTKSVVLMGGATTTELNGAITNDVWEYLTATNKWQKQIAYSINDLNAPEPRQFHRLATLYFSNQKLIY